MRKYRFCGFWQRVIMGLIDFILLASLLLIVYRIFNINDLSKDYTGSSSNYIDLIIQSFSALITLLFWKLWGATPGKMLYKAKIVDVNTGDIPKFWKLILRYVCSYISAIPLFIGVIWIGIDSRKQAWHDKIAGTIVVKPDSHDESDFSSEEELSDEKRFFPSNPNLKDNKKWVFGKILFILSIILAIFVCYVIYYDEPLNKEAERLLFDFDLNEENPEDNGFYYLIGIICEENSDPFQVGYDYVSELNEYVRNQSKFSLYQTTPEISNMIEFEMDYDDMFHYFKSDSVFIYCQSNQNAIREAHKKYSFIKSRFNDVFTNKYFKTMIIPQPDSDLSFLYELNRYNLLENYYIMTLYCTGEKERAVSLLNKQLDITRKLTSISDNRTIKYISEFFIRSTLQTYDNLLVYEDPCNPLIINAIENIQPIQLGERDLSKVLKWSYQKSCNNILRLFNNYESIYGNDNFQLSRSFANSKKTVLFKPFITLNRLYENYFSYIIMSVEDGKSFYQQYRISQDNILLDFDKKINNLQGSMLLSMENLYYFDSAIIESHNIDGFINLLKLKSEIIDQHIDLDNISPFLELKSDSLYNPYNEKAFYWNPDYAVIFFDDPQHKEQNYIDIEYLQKNDMNSEKWLDKGKTRLPRRRRRLEESGDSLQEDNQQNMRIL